MTLYILRKMFSLLITLIAISVLTFWLMYNVPGGPFAEDKRALEGAQRENILKKYGMIGPIYQRYFTYMGNVLKGDFGYSFSSPTEKVQDLIMRVWGPTLTLGGITILIAFPLGITLGIFAAKNQNTWIDVVINTVATANTVIPSFVIALFLILTFAARLKMVPSGGWGGPEHMVLPVAAYVLAPTSTLIRYTRGLMLDEYRLDYVRTARAKGLTERKILFKHVLKNIAIPLTTVFGPTIPLLVTGSVFIETTFRIPGLGQYLVSSSKNRDYPMIMALTLMTAAVWGITLLATDILYVKLDPRVEL